MKQFLSSLSQIPLTRIIIGVIGIGLLPVLFTAWAVFGRYERAKRVEDNVNFLQETALFRAKKQAANLSVRQQFKDANHFYIDKHLETLQFLEGEIETLQKILNNKNVAEDETVKKRLEFLTGNGNTLSFTEGVVQSSPFVQEVVETLIHPVEIDTKDLGELLAKIEGVEIGPYAPGSNRPQLIILEFKLDKKTSLDKNEVYLLNLKLLKREFL